MSPIHQLTAVLVVAIWGTNFVFIRIGLDELSPFTFAALRFALVAFPLVFFLPKPKISWRYIAAYGVFIGVGQFGLLFWAMRSDISPGLASLIVQTQAFFTVILSAVMLSERVNTQQIISLLICLTGLLVIIGFTDGQTTYFGISLVLLAGLSWAAGNVVVKVVGKVDILAFIAWSSVIVAPLLLTVALITDGWPAITQQVSQLSPQGWTVVLWQSIGNTMIGYGLWNLLLARYSAALVAPWSLLVPVFGMGASAIMLGEALPVWKLIAAGLIMLGLAINIVKPDALKRP